MFSPFNPGLGLLMGMRLITAPSMGETRQYRFPRSKKKRIRKKWAKRRQNYRFEPSTQLLINHEKREIYGHPTVIEKLIQAMKERDRNG